MTFLARITMVLALAAGFSLAAPAAEVEGILMDNMCSGKAMKDGGHKAAAAHSKDCALMDSCAGSGFGIVTRDNKFLKFDAAGNKKAMAALKASGKDENIQVKVTGDVNDESIKVDSVKIL